MRALCRVDAGPKRGLGHLQRCLALADALKQRAVPVVFVGPRLEDARDRIEKRSHSVGTVDLAESDAGTGRDVSAVIHAAHKYRCRVVVVDSYDIDNGYVQALRTAGLFVVALDDLASYSCAAQIVVNGGAAATSLPYSSSTGDTIFLLGPDYALLNTAFAQPRKRVISPTVRRVLLSIGGMDPHRILPRMLHCLDEVKRSFTATVVLGPFVDATDEVADRQYRHVVEFVVAPSGLCDLMAGADLAISAGGHTLYELAALGTPTIAVEVFENQAPNIRFLAGEGVVRPAGAIRDDDFDQQLRATVTEVIDDEAARAQLSNAGQRLIDGCGAGRVADEIVRSL